MGVRIAALGSGGVLSNWRVVVVTSYPTGDVTREHLTYRWRWAAVLSRLLSRLTQVDGFFTVDAWVEEV